MSSYPSTLGVDWSGPYDKANRVDTWQEVRTMLQKTYSKTATLSVIPDATGQ